MSWQTSPSFKGGGWLHIDVASHFEAALLIDVDMLEQGYKPVDGNRGFYWANIGHGGDEDFDPDDRDCVIRALPPIKVVAGRFLIGDYPHASVARGTALKVVSALMRVIGRESTGMYNIPDNQSVRLMLSAIAEGEDK